MNVYHCVSRERVEKYLMPLTDKLLVDVIEEQSKGLFVKQTDKDFIAQIYSYVLVGLMLDWVADDMKENPEKLVERLAIVIQGNLSAALHRLCDH